MSLIKRVIGERQQNIPQGFYRALRVSVRNHAIVERGVLFIQLSLFLLTHCAAQKICLTKGVIRHLLGDRHHLFLVHDQTVRGTQNIGKRLLQLGVDRRNLLLTVLAQRIVRMRVRPHRPGTVESKHSGNMLKLFRLHKLQKRTHRPAIELEHTQRITARQQLVGCFIAQLKRL